jgi:hypothetical protein
MKLIGCVIVFLIAGFLFAEEEQSKQYAAFFKGFAQHAHETFSEEWRTWTTSDNKYDVKAKFVRASIVLERLDGSCIEVPMERLCKQDHDWIVHQYRTGLPK